VPQVDGVLYGLLLAIESAREELQPYKTVSPLVQLAETNFFGAALEAAASCD
jgi:hypothetical protein